MPSGDTAEGKAAQRARLNTRLQSISDNGGPKPTGKAGRGLDWYAANLEPRDWDDVEAEVEYVGMVECLVGSGSQSAGGMTLQVQVLPAYIHDAVDMVQRSSQGVLVALLFQAPWDLFKQDTPAWAHLAGESDEWGLNDGDD